MFGSPITTKRRSRREEHENDEDSTFLAPGIKAPQLAEGVLDTPLALPSYTQLRLQVQIRNENLLSTRRVQFHQSLTGKKHPVKGAKL